MPRPPRDPDVVDGAPPAGAPAAAAMRPLRLRALRELLEGAAFSAWWAEWRDAASARDDARARQEDLAAHAALMTLRADLVQRAAVEAFSRSGEAEEEAARWTAEARVEEDRALARSLIGAEHGVLSRRIRLEAERRLAEAEERRSRAGQLSGAAVSALRELRAAEERLTALRAEAQERFGCVPGLAFLYWRHPDDPQRAFAVSLSDQGDGAGGPAARALGVYVVGRERGVAALEAAHDAEAPARRPEPGSGGPPGTPSGGRTTR